VAEEKLVELVAAVLMVRVVILQRQVMRIMLTEQELQILKKTDAALMAHAVKAVAVDAAVNLKTTSD
jgi:hypothetical protein